MNETVVHTNISTQTPTPTHMHMHTHFHTPEVMSLWQAERGRATGVPHTMSDTHNSHLHIKAQELTRHTRGHGSRSRTFQCQDTEYTYVHVENTCTLFLGKLSRLSPLHTYVEITHPCDMCES